MPYKNPEDKNKWQRENWKRIFVGKPWVYTIRAIRARCCNKAHHYYKKGIKNFLSTNDVKALWFRDKAYLLGQPSIDRINAAGDYEIGNCRFMELKDNLQKRSN